jgi:hypothetical protein
MRRLAILEGRYEPPGNVRRSRQLEARPIQALASVAALLPGHFAPFLAARRPIPVFGSQTLAGEGVESGARRAVIPPLAFVGTVPRFDLAG